MNQKTKSLLEKELEKNNECYVLITCGKPSGEGNMQVEMTLGGVDPFLASYLLQGAQNMVDQNIENEEAKKEGDLRLVKS